jgi:hypothetical protein
MAVRQGATDAQVADALRQGLPHLTDPASLQDRRANKQPEITGAKEKGKQPAAQTKRTCTPSQAPTTQPASLAADAFTAALGAIPEDWCVDKMRLPAVVCLSWSFWNEDEDDNGTAKEKRQFVLRQLTGMSALAASPHSNCATVQLQDHMQSGLQECWRSAKRWRTLISVEIKSDQTGQRVLQECWRSVQHWFTSISAAAIDFEWLRRSVTGRTKS